MYIKHLISEDIYFTDSYKDSKDNIILLSWENMKNPTDEFPTTFYKKETLTKNGYKKIETIHNRIIQDLTMTEMLDSEFVKQKEIYKINSILVPIELNINKIFYKINKNGNYQYFYLNDKNKLHKLSTKLGLSDAAKLKVDDFEETTENYFILTGKNKKREEIFKVVDNEKICISLGKQPFCNGYNLEFLDFKLEEDEEGTPDSFHIDYLNNIYVSLNGRLKIIKDGKVKAIKISDIESIFLYKENNEEFLLEKIELNNINIIKKLTLQDLENILWNIADLIRDKSALDDVMDYMRVSIPLLVIKRLLDIREEYLINEVITEDNFTYISNKQSYPDNYIEKTFEDIKEENGIYSVKDNMLPWYGVIWDDIVNFEENDSGVERIVKLKKYNLEIKTKSKTKQDFLEEVINSFRAVGKYEKIKRIFEVTEFMSKIKNTKKVPNYVFMEMIKLLNEYSFSYKNASEDIFSQSYMYLISTFAEGAGKKGGEFFTPTPLIKKLLPTLQPIMPKNSEIKIGDPTSGSCSFVLELADLLKKQIELANPSKSTKDIIDMVNRRIEIITQEKGETSEIMGEVNMMFKNYENHISYQGNTIEDYQKYIGKHRKKINLIVANPPYGLKNYGYEYAVNADEERWCYGVPKKGDGDIAFLLTIIDLLNEENGKSGTLLPLGTLFKDSTKDIRKKLIEEDIIEGLIILPSNMFQTTQIPVVWWIINKDKKPADKGKIFMVNASEEYIKKGKFFDWQEEKSTKNYLERITEEGISGYVELADIEENDLNLSVQRYIFKDEPEEDIDIVQLIEDKKELKENIQSQENEMDNILNMILELEDSNKNK